ncbi:abhydrolase domain-containing protein 4 [Coprinopsis cinerea okayama7|uniref:Abhydrolase domain-containing protein 4 n=1 Tax=Coprinopsis cinerea (strain Okayama-7 / 130 / ATCC MYA-4618 / FGSC 9003) TaxID=240176 RepID=A8NWM2_COPC7|nr:abhydrolase domain-containing protein 4 [Coprinopsis cinerea okayama7\|eukprot:XP_001836930.2 abhydrolase domain-containing protein 4 [Coprinopsis cinerea okayama7\
MASSSTSSLPTYQVLDSLPPSAPSIPSGFTQSVRSWWSNVGFKQSQTAELRILLRVPYFSKYSKPPSTTPNAPLTVSSSLVPLSTPKHYINTLAMTSTDPDTSDTAPPPAVLLHGYGAGLGFFFRNFPTLAHWAEKRRSSVFAIDWLGMGRSARVPFTVKAKRSSVKERVEEAEAFFIDSLEDWRKQMGLERMTLIGHSLGAYLSVAYTLKFPERVAKLVLLSPAGVPRGPNFTEVSRELTDHGADPEGEHHSHPERDPTKAEPASQGRVSSLRSSQKRHSHQTNQSFSRRIFSYLWEEGFSPFQVVRSTLFWGPWLVGKYSSRRFQGLTEEDTRDLHDYILNITFAKGSGEYCISHLLEPGAHARMPIVDRIAGVKVPVTFVYGDHDWMDPVGGMQSVEKLRQAGNGEGKMYIVNNAGHHLYLDNPDAVNALLLKELDKQHRNLHNHPAHHRNSQTSGDSSSSTGPSYHDFY